jgi:hypothetical protein
MVASGPNADTLAAGKSVQRLCWAQADYCILLASVAAPSGDLTLAWTSLQHAIRDFHFENVQEISGQPQLQLINAAQPSDYASLFQVRAESAGRYLSALAKAVVIKNWSWFLIGESVGA